MVECSGLESQCRKSRETAKTQHFSGESEAQDAMFARCSADSDGNKVGTHDIAAAVERMADDILRAAGSGLKHYTDYNRGRILLTALEAYQAAFMAGVSATEAAYRAGANRVLGEIKGGDDE